MVFYFFCEICLSQFTDFLSKNKLETADDISYDSYKFFKFHNSNSKIY